MAPDPATTTFYSQTVFRYSSYDTPFWARNNRSDGRWHITGDGATQYLSLHPDGAWAELLRHENLRKDEELLLVRTTIWAASLTQAGLVDYSTFEKADAAGLAPEALIDDDYSRCQEQGRRLRELGYGGVLAPSAALPGIVNVTLFGRRIRARWGASPRLASSVPAVAVAVGGPPPGLTTRTRYFGDAHAAFAYYVDDATERPRDAALDELAEVDADERNRLEEERKEHERRSDDGREGD